MLVTVTNLLPLSYTFTLQYLLCDTGMGSSKALLLYSGLRLGPISRERWRASFPSSNAAVVLFSVAPSAQHSQQCLGRACRSLLNSQLWPCPWPGSHFTVPHTPMQTLQAGHTEPASTAVLFPDLPLHSHLLALHLLGFLQLWAPAEPAFSLTWHVQWRGVLQCPPAE